MVHIDFDIRLSVRLDFRIIFGQVYLAEIERLKLLGREAAAHRLFRGAQPTSLNDLSCGQPRSWMTRLSLVLKQ